MKTAGRLALVLIVSAGLCFGQATDNATAQKIVPQETHITPEQAKDLFHSVGVILKFASDDSRLPIRHDVKRKLTTREAVEKYLVEKMNDDKDAKRMERSEIVLKKFGLLDRDFQLRPFLLQLLKEQIEAYYDSKTKTVNLLDWATPETQKPVLAHELTHALQDQHVDLDKWEDVTSDDLSHNVKQDNEHIQTDEVDTAREAVLEGQAMAVYVDYSLAPSGKSLLTAPDMLDDIEDSGDTSDSPILARAPLVLKESLLFPYQDGLKFEQVLLKSKGQEAAFAGVLDRPPSSSYEIINPRAYMRKQQAPVLRMPDVHALLDADYDPYDVGVMGQLDVRMLSELFGGEQAAATLAPAWDGGIYYAVQSKKAKTDAEKDSTASIGLLYLSRWKSDAAAKAFAKMYADELGKKYSGVKRDNSAEADETEQVYKTSEGPVLISTSGRMVFVSESFDLTTARKLAFLVTGAQGSDDDMQAARLNSPHQSNGRHELTASMVRFFSGCGMMRAAVAH
ncbi:MAG TPA: hypothetical protein VHT24_07770 [Pseudacidobacterium sp.]|jgi:hypothetical protein|nr:hypothetical protein [Pseudacidobacterium sp.]